MQGVERGRGDGGRCWGCKGCKWLGKRGVKGGGLEHYASRTYMESNPVLPMSTMKVKERVSSNSQAYLNNATMF